MLSFFKDAQLTRPAFGDTPKFFLFDESGGTVESTLWIGDTYAAVVMEDAAIGDTTLTVDQTAEFPTAGTFTVNGIPVTYTGTTSTTFTGIPASGAGSITAAILAGSSFQPTTVYTGVNLSILPSGPNVSGVNPEVFISLKTPTTAFALPNSAIIVPAQSYGPGQPALALGIKVECKPGSLFEFNALTLEIGNYPGNVVSGALSVFRANTAPDCYVRILPQSRAIDPTPGFQFGKYRWRDALETNAHMLVPSQWDASVSGVNKYVAGIGDNEDLAFSDITKNGISINPSIKGGFYFTGPQGYYLPVNPHLEFIPNASYSPASFTLAKTRKPQTPIFVGQFQLDQYGYYDASIQYRYIGKSYSAATLFDPNDPGLQFAFDPSSQTITLNKLQPVQTVFLGAMPAGGQKQFDLPFHPVSLVSTVYADNPLSYTTSFTVDYGLGTIDVTAPSAEDWTGRPIFVTCHPAVAVLYDTVAKSETRPLDLDLNPAHAGISDGYIHLMHRRWKPTAIQLFCDKPRISLPPSISTAELIQDLFGSQLFGQGSRVISTPQNPAYGPVYYANDYALLMATAYGSSSTDVVPNVHLTVSPGSNFQGTLNYQDPTAETVDLYTGGDGTASMIYSPGKGYGYYLDPSASLSNVRKTVTLPETLPLALVWNSLDGFYCYIYLVRNDDEFLGKVGANAALGETAWATQGTPGTVGYKTNGRRVLIKTPLAVPVKPTDLLDENGVSYTAGGFTGNVKQVLYADSLPTASNVGAYFIGVSGLSTLMVTAPEYGVSSNVITLELAHPVEIIDFSPDGNPYIPQTSGYLIFDSSTSGRLNVNRLAGGPLPSIILNLPRV
jgi:hypothetical protein